jgi:hypothetical protein
MKTVFAVLLKGGGFLGASGDEIDFISCGIHFDSQGEAAKVASRFGGTVVPTQSFTDRDYSPRRSDFETADV